MFEVDGKYANRNGEYTVLEIGPTRMKIRYDSGEETELSISIQERIWQNIQTEYEAKSTRTKRSKGKTKVKHFIKSVPGITDAELTPGDIRAIVTPTGSAAPSLNAGDRFIYYAVGQKRFFAVATITGDPKNGKSSDYPDLNFQEKTIKIYPIDIDAHAKAMSKALTLETVELESQPKYRDLLGDSQTYLDISEDDFELLAESLTEYVEGEEDDEEIEDEIDDGEEDLSIEDDLDI